MSGRASVLGSRDYAPARAVGVRYSIAPLFALAGVVAISIAIRAVLGTRTASPWIVPDELIYAELAKSLAWLGELSIRGVPTLGYGIGYPALLAPAYALAGDPVHGYALAKLTNAVLMSLAAVPAYLVSRRVLDPWPSVLAAALALSIPSFAYTAVIMTENAFYPLFLTSILAMVLALERPSAGRQLAVLVAIAAAFAVRAQGLVLLPAFLAAVTVMAAVDARREEGTIGRTLLPRLDRFRLTWLVVASAGLAVVVVQAVRGSSTRALLGIYEVVVENVSFRGLLESSVYHAGAIDLYVGVIPLAASLFLVGCLWDRTAQRELQVFVVVAACAVLAMLLVVAAFGSKPYAGALGFEASPSRLRERNLFYVAPLLLIGLVCWLRGGMPRRGRAGLAVALVAAVLPLTVPYGSSLYHASFQALAVAPWAVLGAGGAAIGASAFAILAAAGFYFAPARWAPFVIAFVVANFVIVSFVAVSATQISSQQTRERSIGTARPDWIDDAVGDGSVTVLWAPHARWSEAQTHRNLRVVWINEFFNRRVEGVYHLGRPMPYALPSSPVALHPDGSLVREADGSPLVAHYVLAPCSLALRGRLIGSDASAGIGLHEVEGPLRVRRGEEAERCSPAE